MKKAVKLIAILLVVTLLAGVLCACHRDNKNDAAKKRNTAASDVVNGFLSGMDEKWSRSMSVGEIAALDNAGEYVVASAWTELVVKVLSSTSIQTVKLQALASKLASEDGKRLMSEFSQNAELIVPMLKEIGFTGSDISQLAYELIVSLTRDGESTLKQIINSLDEVLDELDASQSTKLAAIENVRENRASTERAVDMVKMSEDERTEILGALTNAKDAFEQLVSFAYESSVEAITDELYDKLISEDGALGSITENELGTLVRAILANVGSLGDALGKEDVASLNSALNLFIIHFDNNAITSQLYAQLVTYAKYAYMVVDVIPAICDMVVACSDTLSDASYIGDLLKASKLSEELDTDTNALNAIILAARLVDSVMSDGSYTEQGISALVDEISIDGQDAYQKAMPLILLDLLLNVSELTSGFDEDVFRVAHSDILTEEDLQNMLAGIFLNGFVDSFKAAYYSYIEDGTEDSYSKMYNYASLCTFKNFTTQTNPYNARTQTSAWYNWYMTNALPRANEVLGECVGRIKLDIKAFVADYFAQNSKSQAAIRQIAQMQIFESTLPEDELSEKYMQALADSRLFGFAMLVA